MYDHLRPVLVRKKRKELQIRQVSVFVELESTRSVTAAAVGQASKFVHSNFVFWFTGVYICGKVNPEF